MDLYYPFLLYSENIDQRPVFTGLVGDPYVADLSPHSPLLQAVDVRDQKAFQRILEGGHGHNLPLGFLALS